jgi:predicted SAM-dependent methyltransferase
VRSSAAFGSVDIDGAINFDQYGSPADRKLHCTDRGEFSDKSVGLIETNHTIDHLSIDECSKASREWNPVMRRGAYPVISCPDLDRITSRCRWVSASEREYVLKMLYGSQKHAGMCHRSEYCRNELKQFLGTHRFFREFTYSAHPQRPTPSLFVIFLKISDNTQD